jgi:hypothetical protein
MRKAVLARTLLLSGGWLVVLACGSRTGLAPGRVLGAAGSSPTAGAAGTSVGPEPECVTAQDCPQPSPEQCGVASCNAGACALDRGQVCDDGDPCTVDSCATGRCSFASGRVDADGDGAFASGNSADPKAKLGCGDDCDDASPQTFPGALEQCDALDNDCNGVVDDGTGLTPSLDAPTRVSPADAESANAEGLAFDGQSFGATITHGDQRPQGLFQQLDARGKLVGAPLRIARVNAAAYGGPLRWSGERYLTAYQDARQDGNYEIYFDHLNRNGERLIEDLRVTSADDFSLRPSLLWTGAESLLVWDDRRFEGSGDESVLFGQRIAANGQLLGANLRLSPDGLSAEDASTALSDKGVGIAFLALDDLRRTRLNFLRTSRSLAQPSAVLSVEFDDPDEPVVAAFEDEYVVTFHQRTATSVGPSIYGVVIGPNGVVRGPLSMTSGAGHARTNATFSYGDRFVMVWADDSAGRYQLYAQTFDRKLAPITPRVRLTNTMSDTLGPVVTSAADGGLGVLYTDGMLGVPQAFFTRLDCMPRNLGLK